MAKAEVFGLDPEMILEVTLGKREGDTRTLQARLGDFPPNAIEKVLRYGFQRVFNDRVGGSDKTLEDKVGDVEDMIAKYKRGEIGRQVAAGVDAVTKLARQKARAALRAKNPEAAKKLKDREDANEVLDAIVAKNPALREEAEAEIAAKAKPLEVDLGDVDL